MNTMHELLMPELNELKIAGRQAEAEQRRWTRTMTAANPATTGGRLVVKLHLPRLRRGSTAGAV